jgi:hypothetical protein
MYVGFDYLQNRRVHLWYQIGYCPPTNAARTPAGSQSYIISTVLTGLNVRSIDTLQRVSHGHLKSLLTSNAWSCTNFAEFRDC